MSQLEMYRGDTLPLKTVVYAKGSNNTELWPIDDLDFRFTVKFQSRDLDSNSILQFDNTRFALDLPSSTITWEIEPADMDDAFPGPMQDAVIVEWDLQATAVGAQTKPFTIDRGQLLIKPDISITAP